MKTGIVLEGGASRGFFSVGALDALYDMGFKADCLVGASAGIANGLSFVSGQRGRGLEIGLRHLPDKRYMGLRHLLNPKNRSLYNIKYVFDDLPHIYLPFDYEAYDNSGCKAFAALTNMRTGKCEYHLVTSDDKELKTVVASCALPLLFQPVEINGEIYMDGGISNSVPIEKAFDEGCEKIVVVLTRERSYVKEEEKLLALSTLLYKKYPAFTSTLKNRTQAYNDAHKHILELEKDGKIILIAPEEDTSGWKRTERRPSEIQKMYDIGYKTTIKYKDKLVKC